MLNPPKRHHHNPLSHWHSHRGHVDNRTYSYRQIVAALTLLESAYNVNPTQNLKAAINRLEIEAHALDPSG